MEKSVVLKNTENEFLGFVTYYILLVLIIYKPLEGRKIRQLKTEE